MTRAAIMAFNRMIMKKIRISAEIFYLVAFNLIGLAVALLDKGHFGMSTIVAPNYAIYLKVSQTIWPGATLGVISYIIQGCLLIALCLVIRRFRFTYLLSFFTAVVTGYSIDGFMALMASWPAEAMRYGKKAAVVTPEELAETAVSLTGRGSIGVAYT